MSVRRGGFLAAIVAFTAIVGASTASQAGVMFTLGNHPETDEENILFDGAVTSGTMITGESNQTHAPVDFSSTHTIYLQGGGQAMIEATDQHPNRTDITNLSITTPGYTFRDFIMNMLNGHGMATITANTAASGAFTFNMALGNGENYLTVLATGGDMLSSLSISADGFSQLKQPRISGPVADNVSNPPPSNGVPEPASLGLAGLGLMALGFTRRKRI